MPPHHASPSCLPIMPLTSRVTSCSNWPNWPQVRWPHFWLRDLQQSEAGSAISVGIDEHVCHLHAGDTVLCEASPYEELGPPEGGMRPALMQVTASMEGMQVWPQVAVWARPTYTTSRPPICRELPKPRGLRKAYIGRLPTNMVCRAPPCPAVPSAHVPRARPYRGRLQPHLTHLPQRGPPTVA